MSITKLALATSFVFTFACAIVLAAPGVISADTASRLGGGNALVRNTTGVANANVASDILSRMNFASTRGGQQNQASEDENTDTVDENTEEETNDEGADASQANQNANANQNQNENDHANGGAEGINGGDGGDAGPGGLVRSGDIVSNATAINMINTVIIRIGR